jgi:hypothetical protein
MVVRAPTPVPDIAAVTNAEGKFVFEDIPAGEYRLRAVGETGEVGETNAIVPQAGDANEVIIRLKGAESSQQ